MRRKHNSLAEKLWYVIQECVAAGVTIEEFRREAEECWVEEHRQRAEHAREEFRRKLD